MPTYIYESIPEDGAAPRRFEVVQSMNDRPLETHPETGEPVRRIITGGLGIKGKPIRRSTEVNKSLAAATPCGCSRTALAETAGARGRASGCGHGHRGRTGAHRRHGH